MKLKVLQCDGGVSWVRPSRSLASIENLAGLSIRGFPEELRKGVRDVLLFSELSGHSIAGSARGMPTLNS